MKVAAPAPVVAGIGDAGRSVDPAVSSPGHNTCPCGQPAQYNQRFCAPCWAAADPVLKSEATSKMRDRDQKRRARNEIERQIRRRIASLT